MPLLRAPDSSDADALSFDVDLPLTERAAALARRTVIDVLRSWQLTDEEWTYDVLLLTTELVGNAVRHGAVRVGLGLTLHETALEVEVSDGSSVVPTQRERADESGRGLTIITALAADWGVTEQDDGKTVWTRITLPSADGEGRAADGADVGNRPAT